MTTLHPDAPVSSCARRVMYCAACRNCSSNPGTNSEMCTVNPHGGHSDQRPLDVVPQFERLLPPVDPVARDKSGMVFGGRVERLPRSRRAEDRRQKRRPGNRPSEEHVRSRAELLTPICSGVDPVFQFSEVGTESFSGPDRSAPLFCRLLHPFEILLERLYRPLRHWLDSRDPA